MLRHHVPQRLNQIDWVNLLFIGGYHIALAIALPLYLSAYVPSAALWGWTAVLLVGSGISITAGYHRLYAHRTYRTKRPIEWVLLFFGSLSTQGSVLRWAHDHRIHHRYVDTEKDPYDTYKGFWHSHLLWMFKKRPPIDERYIPDLKKDRLLVHQDRYYVWWMGITNLGSTLLIGWITGEMIGAFVIAFLLRLFITHHTTWFINSLAHMWGSKPYSTEHSAVNNFILAFLTYGEGYHNFHHTFAGDFRNGIRWYQFDPAKYFIWMLHKLGLASDLKRTDPLMIQKRLIQADRHLLIDHLKQLQHLDTEPFVEAVERMADKLSTSIATARRVMNEYRQVAREGRKEEMRKLKETFKQVRRELRHDFKTWKRLCRLVLKMEPIPAAVVTVAQKQHLK